MITVSELARSKHQVISTLAQDSSSCRYDHVSQMGRHAISADIFRISMKSDTAFDGEADAGDEDGSY